MYFYLDSLDMQLDIDDIQMRLTKIEDQLEDAMARIAKLENKMNNKSAQHVSLKLLLEEELKKQEQEKIDEQIQQEALQVSLQSADDDIYSISSDDDQPPLPPPVNIQSLHHIDTAISNIVINLLLTVHRKNLALPDHLSFILCSLQITTTHNLLLVHGHHLACNHQSLCRENVIGTLAVKLANESFVGNEVLKRCTVMGCRDYPALPLKELNELKQVIFFVSKVLVQPL